MLLCGKADVVRRSQRSGDHSLDAQDHGASVIRLRAYVRVPSGPESR